MKKTLLILLMMIVTISFCIKSCIDQKREERKLELDKLLEAIDKSDIDAPHISQYDELQEVFISIKPSCTTEEIKETGEEGNVVLKTYNRGNRVYECFIYKAEDEEKIGHKESWQISNFDYILVYFSKVEKEFLYSEYFNSAAKNFALLYNHGDSRTGSIRGLQATEPNNEYAGYYWFCGDDYNFVNDYKYTYTNIGGTRFHFPNGDRVTGLYKCENAERAIDFAVNKIETIDIDEYKLEKLYKEFYDKAS